MSKPSDQRLIIVSNRLPVSLKKDGGRWQVQPSSGGLVTALGPVLRNRGGLWIGWPGVPHLPDARQVLERATRGIGYTLVPVSLTEEELSLYYYGFSNEVVWPLFHGLQSLCNYDPDYWTAYQRVNSKFARVVNDHMRPDDYVWIHDYQLMNVAQELRALNARVPIGFFLHIPFPPPDIYHKLPWRRQLLESLLNFDLLGFQTNRHKRNFMQCVRTMIRDVQFYGKGPVSVARFEGREVRVGYFPIGIDYQSFARGAQEPEVEAESKNLKFALRNRTLILGIDRLDYTKGIPYKLDAMRLALKRYPELNHRVTLIQVVVPSRQEIPRYDALKTEIERLVGEINGEFAEPGWVPIQYIYRSLSRNELLAYYRTAEIALITPLDDGMNLVAKEYCAATVDGNGVLILSEFAGAASQLRRGALLVNPYNREAMAEAIYQAYKMDPQERAERMQRLRRNVANSDVFRWVSSFLQAGISQELADFPQQEVDPEVFDEEFWSEII
ncbi:MAG TPA: trehalose-6-phosphate synthase [bacterium]|nr:trehalose-6-phosphate synthase [bacterium]